MAETTKKPAAKATLTAEEKAAKKAAKEAEKAAKEAEKASKEAEKAAKKAEKEAKKASKEKKEEKPKATSARCFVRDIRITPRKVRFVADYVRGKDVKEALAILKNVNKVAAKPVAKAIASAAANATNNFGMNRDALYVAEIQVGDGLKIKRYIPRAKGSASGIIKRNANLTVVVKERN